MHQHERHQLILEQARSHPRVEVTSLADTMGVTPETVRRDLTALERRGVVRRVHGGAIAIERIGFEPAVDVRNERHLAEKLRIAQLALAEIPESGSILLDSGTTVQRLAEMLPSGRDLTVVTNSLTIAGVVSARTDLDLFILGGRVRPRTLAAVGDWGVEALHDIHLDVAFLGTNGVSSSRGLTTPDQSEALTKRSMVGAAQRCVLLADHSKVGTNHFARFADLSQIDTFITDTGLDPETLSDLEGLGLRVLRA